MDIRKNRQKEICSLAKKGRDSVKKAAAGTATFYRTHLTAINSVPPHLGHFGISVVLVSNLMLAPHSLQR